MKFEREFIMLQYFPNQIGRNSYRFFGTVMISMSNYLHNARYAKYDKETLFWRNKCLEVSYSEYQGKWQDWLK